MSTYTLSIRAGTSGINNTFSSIFSVRKSFINTNSSVITSMGYYNCIVVRNSINMITSNNIDIYKYPVFTGMMIDLKIDNCLSTLSDTGADDIFGISPIWHSIYSYKANTSDELDLVYVHPLIIDDINTISILSEEMSLNDCLNIEDDIIFTDSTDDIDIFAIRSGICRLTDTLLLNVYYDEMHVNNSSSDVDSDNIYIEFKNEIDLVFGCSGAITDNCHLVARYNLNLNNGICYTLSDKISIFSVYSCRHYIHDNVYVASNVGDLEIEGNIIVTDSWHTGINNIIIFADDSSIGITSKHIPYIHYNLSSTISLKSKPSYMFISITSSIVMDNISSGIDDNYDDIHIAQLLEIPESNHNISNNVIDIVYNIEIHDIVSDIRSSRTFDFSYIRDGILYTPLEELGISSTITSDNVSQFLVYNNLKTRSIKNTCISPKISLSIISSELVMSQIEINIISNYIFMYNQFPLYVSDYN